MGPESNPCGLSNRKADKRAAVERVRSWNFRARKTEPGLNGLKQ